MLVSTRGRYALRVMIDLAQHSPGGYIPLRDIAARQGISEKYLESIEKALAGQKKYLVSPDVDVNNLYANYGQSWFLPSQGEETGETEGQSGQENTAGTGDASSTETSTGEGS